MKNENELLNEEVKFHSEPVKITFLSETSYLGNVKVCLPKSHRSWEIRCTKACLLLTKILTCNFP